MLKFNPPLEPENFDEKVRQPGNNWLEKNTDPKKRPIDYWSKFKSDLADGFNNLCGYSVMYEPVGTVEHFLSCENHRHLAYEWSNYRLRCNHLTKTFYHINIITRITNQNNTTIITC